MKKRLAMLLICAVTVSSLMACGKPVADSTNTNDTQVVETEDDTAKNEPVSGSAPEISFTSVSADDYEYFTGHVQCLQITDDDHPELKDAVEKYFSGLVKNFNSGIDEMNEQAKQENEDFGDAEYQVKYSDDITVEIMRRDNKLLSLVINDYTFMGGAHGGGSYTGVNFDVATVVDYDLITGCCTECVCSGKCVISSQADCISCNQVNCIYNVDVITNLLTG